MRSFRGLQLVIICSFVPLQSAICQKALTSFVLPNRIPCVVSVDGHQHITRQFFQDRKWHTDDLTAAANAPLPLDNTELTSFVLHDGSPHIVFTDRNHHLVQLFYVDKWRFDDLTNAAHAPVASQERGLSSFVMADGSPHIAFIDGRQHIIQLFFLDNRWRFEDISGSAVPSAKLASPRSELSSFVIPSGSPEIAFIDKQSHITQLFFLDAKWHSEDLTAASSSGSANR